MPTDAGDVSPAPRVTSSSATSIGEEGPPVLLLHGGGQTRHAWRKTGEALAALGRVAYAIDQRGHGDSEWVEDGAYSFPISRRMRGALRHARTRTARGRSRSARRSAAWPRCWRRAALSERCDLFAPSCWSTSRRASIRGVAKSAASCAGTRARASRPSRKRPMPSPRICRTGRGRLKRRLEEKPAAASRRPLALALGSALS